MATPDYTAGEVMENAAAFLNDVARQVYTNAILLPYAKQAVRDLRELMQQSNLPVTNEVDEILSVTAGTTEISFVTSPALPENLTEIRQIWERPHDSNPWVPMQRVEFLPYWQDGQTVQQFSVAFRLRWQPCLHRLGHRSSAALSSYCLSRRSPARPSGESRRRDRPGIRADSQSSQDSRRALRAAVGTPPVARQRDHRYSSPGSVAPSAASPS